MMGEHLLELDPEPDLIEAFACFDDKDKGVVDVKEMRKWLGEYGDKMEDWEVGLWLLLLTDGRSTDCSQANSRTGRGDSTTPSSPRYSR